MRYHFKKSTIFSSVYGVTYTCEHPVYDACTLFKIGDEGLAVIQQRYDSYTKRTWWGPIDSSLTDVLYLHPQFKEYFNQRAGCPENDIYPTVTIRQIMWALRLKPLKKEPWETTFDRRNI